MYLHADEVPGAVLAARHVVPLILEAVGAVQSVVDLGGGTGAWLRTMQRHGVETVLLIDTPEVEPDLLVDTSNFLAANLERGFPEVPRFDLAVCVEVAEHLQAERAEPLVEWLTSTADRVVFSAALPGQHGKGHVHLQPPGYWAGLFAARGFVRRDVLRGRLIQEDEVPFWYRQNLLVYTREPALVASTEPDFLPGDFVLVHETNAAMVPPAPPVGVGTLVRMVGPAVAYSVRKWLGRG